MTVKSAFISLWMLTVSFALGHAGWELVRAPSAWVWWSVLVGCIPAALFFVWVYFWPVARTPSVLWPVFLVHALGTLLLLSTGNRALVPWLYVLGVGWLGSLAYQLWYSRFGRERSLSLAVGQPLPELLLEDERQRPVDVRTLPGSLLLIFYRGNWCPLCMAQIREVAGQYKELAARGVQTVLISSQPHAHTASLAAKFNVPFHFLVDRDNRMARKLGILAHNGTPLGLQALGYSSDTAMPTVVLTDAHKQILFCDETDNYRLRPEPEVFMNLLNGTLSSAVRREQTKVGPHTLSWLQSGDEGNPVALFLHGIPASAELWRDVLPQVAARGYLCLAPDLPGYGETRMGPSAGYSLSAAASLLLTWLRERGHTGIWLIAHDIGGGVAQLMLTSAEELFARATLSNAITADTWPVTSVKMMRALAKLKLFAPMSRFGLFPNAIAHRALRKAVANQSVLTQGVQRRIFWDGKVSSERGRDEFQRMLSALDAQETKANMGRLSRVSVPVHLLWAEDDPNQPWSGPGQILASTLGRVAVSRLKATGHFLQIDNPEGYVAQLLSGARG
jgi:pimeloyl-ACP methyl ester carboxylesterase/peroxiredoxin